MEKIYTVKEVAEILRTYKGFIYQLIETGELKAFKAGAWKIKESALQEYINNAEKK